MLYFIPDWDDRVDPGYNFETDTHTAGRDPYRHDRYAHEIYGQDAPYDGILLSRAVLDDSPAKLRAIQDAGSVHAYLRLPDPGRVLGDCGAFSYWQQENPPYSTADMVDFYEGLGFDWGVSVDHLIFSHDDAERRRRHELTLANAEDLLEHHNGECRFTPIGVAQGWNPASYREAVRQLLGMRRGQMEYRHIAIGGLVRSTTADVLRILQEIRHELRGGTQVHLFGVNRPEYAQAFVELGVTSFDSASRLRRAWMDGRRNYFLGNCAYSAIRIPFAASVLKALQKQGREVDEAAVRRLEAAALGALRQYDDTKLGLEETLAAVFAYDELAGEVKVRTRQDYRETLQAAPWRLCSCAICHEHGVEVIIFRGNNRNRRRGFHNTWQLYRQLHGHAQELPAPIAADAPRAEQLALPVPA